ncbi:MAG: hypothetical protein R3D25_09665 [Geminicoccaceae bacterium]
MRSPQLQLTWWRFRRHKVAGSGETVVILFYLIAIFADFLCDHRPLCHPRAAQLHPPQKIHWFDEDGSFRPVFALKGKRDMKTFRLVYAPDPEDKRYLTLLARGYSYRLLGLFETDRHLIGLDRGAPEEALFIPRHRPARPGLLVPADARRTPRCSSGSPGWPFRWSGRAAGRFASPGCMAAGSTRSSSA